MLFTGSMLTWGAGSTDGESSSDVAGRAFSRQHCHAATLSTQHVPKWVEMAFGLVG